MVGAKFEPITQEEYHDFVLTLHEQGEDTKKVKTDLIRLTVIVPRGIADEVLWIIQRQHSLYDSIEDFVLESLRRNILRNRPEE